MTPNIRLRAALCLALSLADVFRARADEPKPAAPPAAPALQAADDADQNPCAKYADTVATWQRATHRLKVAKREVDRLEAEPIMVSEGRCSGDASWRCRDNYFNRERALERARDRLEDAQTRVTQVEESARVAGVPQRCLVE